MSVDETQGESARPEEGADASPAEMVTVPVELAEKDPALREYLRSDHEIEYSYERPYGPLDHVAQQREAAPELYAVVIDDMNSIVEARRADTIRADRANDQNIESAQRFSRSRTRSQYMSFGGLVLAIVGGFAAVWVTDEVLASVPFLGLSVASIIGQLRNSHKS